MCILSRITITQLAGQGTGIFNGEATIDRSTGTRSYATEYYYAQESNTRLTIFTQAKVTRISFAAESKPLLASGIEMFSNNQTIVLNATKEVILSAGTFQSPQILELSGVAIKDYYNN